MRHWLGIDIGGTFTDFALYDTQTGELTGVKVASTPHDFAEAVRLGLERLRDENGVDLSYAVAATEPSTLAIVAIGEDGSNQEETKMVQETHKIWGDDTVGITATCVRVPVLGSKKQRASVMKSRRYCGRKFPETNW